MANRLLTVNIRNYINRQPRGKRRNRAVRYIRERIAHYTGTEIENVKIDKKLNEAIFKVYSKTALPVKMKLDIDGSGIVTASPFTATITDSSKPAEEGKKKENADKKPSAEKVNEKKAEKPKEKEPKESSKDSKKESKSKE
ncbi:50S ribosomal protein L31e [Candidatus Mancarchaeum acidiphilum]|uniref:Large ribosomal subunit protein eL31 n=1 Tax=Candidatus Mancarchaeum acidiphilum TaxID=1920749 RepID=A0A218NNZ9_9ARCH|nr:hypothetical protein [Candidatus Mancarchaeum acidiphilum]ASI14207.1 50S ribosomal protein L31e [Candidatus Mancarchaeum acidiphilum]